MKHTKRWPIALTRSRTRTVAATLGLIAIVGILVAISSEGAVLRVDGAERAARAFAATPTAMATVAAKSSEKPRTTPMSQPATAPTPSSSFPEASLDVVRAIAATVAPGATTPTYPVAVDFPTATDGWVLDGGCFGNGVCTIFRTTDGGATWQPRLQTHFALHALSFLNAQDGWLPGEDCSGPGTRRSCTGLLLHTADGGESWTTIRTGDVLFSDVHFVSPRLGWAVASGCSLGVRPCASDLRQSTDGGATWLTVPLGGFRVSAVRFVDAHRGWIAGCAAPADASQQQGCSHPEVRATADGGASWQTQLHLPTSRDTFRASLTFFDAYDGWLLATAPSGCTMGGCWGTLYRTTNGGQNWVKLQSDYYWQMSGDTNGFPPGFPGPPAFASPSIGWIPIAAGAGPGVGGIARTTDGGKTWVRTGALQHWDIRGVSAVSPRSVWIVGSLADFDFLLHSNDAGQTWTQILPRPSPAQAVDFLDPSLGWGIGTSSDPGAVLSTVDAGKSWRRLTSIARQQLRRLSFVDARHGWLVGQDSQPPWATFTLFATADGGHTWHAIARRSEPVAALKFFSARDGIMLTSHADRLAGSRVTTLTSHDGGATWTTVGQVSPGNGSVDVQAADFSSLTDGWIVTADRSGRLHLSATTDGGRSWKPLGVIPGGPAWSPVSVRAISNKIGWLGLGQTLLATEDGGQTWTEVSLPTGVVVASLDVVDANVGWLVSTDGRLVQTHDGGKSWVPSAGQLATP